jgi:hypothetical protein
VSVTVLEAFRISDFLQTTLAPGPPRPARAHAATSRAPRRPPYALSDGWRKAIDAVHSFFGRIGTSKERIALRPSQPAARRVYQLAALP